MKRFFIFFAFLFGTFVAQAQVPDSVFVKPKKERLDTIAEPELAEIPVVQEKIVEPDSTKKKRKPKKDRFLYRVFNDNYPNPKTAMLLSFALPGTGQLYNKRWWKAPLVYGGMGWAIYEIVDNTNQYFRFRDAYILALAGEEHEFSLTRLNSPSDLKRIRDGFDKNRQLSFIAALLVYGVQGAEAFVDAHLKTFDVSDDLSLRLRVKPSFETDYLGGATTGIGLSFQLEKKKQIPTFQLIP